MMNPVRTPTYRLSPQGAGWRLAPTNGDVKSVETIEQASQLLPQGAVVHLALPTHMLILERMTLPSLDADELAGMAELQLEKTLPYPLQEVASSILLIHPGESSSPVLSIAVRLTHLEELCAPIRARGAILGKITAHAADFAASRSPHENALGIYEEDGHIVTAIFDHSRLAWAHSTPIANSQNFVDELPGLLLGAEMEGASTVFAKVYLDSAFNDWREPLTNRLSAPVEILSVDGTWADSGLDLVPQGWLRDAANAEKSVKRKRSIVFAGAAYLTALAGAFGYIGWLTLEAGRLDAKFAAVRPRMEELQAMQARWNAMEPAINPDRATVELLYQLCRQVPKDKLHLTEFDQSVTQWKVFGESDSAEQAIEYLGKLKEEKELSEFNITAGPPSLLPNGSAQFSIFGKR